MVARVDKLIVVTALEISPVTLHWSNFTPLKMKMVEYRAVINFDELLIIFC